MLRKILVITGLVWSLSGFSQKILNGYSAPQTVVDGSSIRLLPGFHANSNDGSYNGNPTQFIAKIGNPSTETVSPSLNIGSTNTSLAENFIYTRSYLVPVNTSNSYAPQIQSISYFDGLGRPKQNIAIKSTPGKNDVVTKIEYDAFGRSEKDFLPMPQQGSSNSSYYGSVSESVGASLYGAGPYYSKKDIENSPLDRINATTAPGEWSTNGKKIHFDYQTNGLNEVLNFITNTPTPSTGQLIRSTLSLIPSFYYLPGTLYKNQVTDEDDNISYEYKNGRGQVILVRKMLTSSNPVDTYYIYNEYDQLAFVLPPLASDAVKNNLSGIDLSSDGNTLAELSYQYRYDARGRLAEKKLPGKGLNPETGEWNWDLMVYDNQDRLVMTQDANLKKLNQWLFTKYDQFGRVAYTGITSESRSRSDIQITLNDKGSNNVTRTSSSFAQPGLLVYYDNDATKNYPNTITKLLSVNYYDTYPADKPNLTTLNFTQSFITDTAQSSSISTKSLPVASYLNNIEMNSWTKTFSYYDDKGRGLANYSKNYLGGYTKTETFLDFIGTPQKTIKKHKRKSLDAEVQITERFTYDHQNRIKKHYHQIDNNSEVLLAESTYDELGQLITKKVGDNLQELNYTYNIRGWMTGINNLNGLGSDLFAYKINYNTLGINSTTPYLADLSLEIKPKFNGNISQVDWIHAGTPRNVGQSYGYVYDKLNRLKAGFHYNRILSRYSFTEENNELLSYDKNGNITNLKRFSYKVGTAPSLIDDLGYQYTGNRLTTVVDNSGDYNGYEGGGNIIEYDDNGNMTNMLDKRITSIGYNHLNLPNITNIGTGKLKASVSNTYRADGMKLKKIYTSNGPGISGTWVTNIYTTDYLDGFQYLHKTGLNGVSVEEGLEAENDLEVAMEIEAFQKDIVVDPSAVPGETTLENAVLQFVPTTEGYYSFTENRYIYQYKDHLGNVRVSYGRDSAGNIEVMDKNDYYPFGMNHLNPDSESYFGQSSYKNYKYNGKELQETGMYDYGARFYMPDIGRWGVVDPLAESHPEMTPFRYSFNNPINAVDPTGMLEDWYTDDIGNVSWQDSQEDYLTGSNGENLTRLGKSGSYLNANGGKTTLNEDRTVTQGGNTSIAISPIKMSYAAMGGDTINSQGTTPLAAVFDTTKYSEPSPIPLQSPALTDPTASLMKFYVEWQAGSAVMKGFGNLLFNESLIIGNGGNYVSSMNIVREINKGENISDLVATLQSRTLSTGVEHAVVKLGQNSAAPGARVIVSGGPHGISFAPGEVTTIFGHTHPYVTGASAADFEALKILNQSRQYIIEGFNPPMMIRKP